MLLHIHQDTLFQCGPSPLCRGCLTSCSKGGRDEEALSANLPHKHTACAASPSTADQSRPLQTLNGWPVLLCIVSRGGDNTPLSFRGRSVGCLCKTFGLCPKSLPRSLIHYSVHKSTEQLTLQWAVNWASPLKHIESHNGNFSINNQWHYFLSIGGIFEKHNITITSLTSFEFVSYIP